MVRKLYKVMLAEEYPTYYKKRKGSLNLLHLAHNCLLKHIIEGKIDGGIEVTGRQRRRRKQLLYDRKEKNRILETERGSTRSHSVKNSLWKRLWPCR